MVAVMKMECHYDPIHLPAVHKFQFIRDVAGPVTGQDE